MMFPRPPGVPFHPQPWSQVAENLWVGGHRWERADGFVLHTTPLARDFDLVVDVAGCLPEVCPTSVTGKVAGETKGVAHLTLPDRPLTPVEMAVAIDAAAMVAGGLDAENRVLVRCHAGYNRSAFVAGLALVERGEKPADVLRLLRTGRGEMALHNAAFIRYLLDGFKVGGTLR